MTEKEILENLCSYDPRNPFYDAETAAGRRPRTACWCDNCFYGRDKMATALLRLKQDSNDMGESRQTQFTRCPKCKRLHDSGWECVHCKSGGA